jgi:hypothetical protein
MMRAAEEQDVVTRPASGTNAILLCCYYNSEAKKKFVGCKLARLGKHSDLWKEMINSIEQKPII